MYSSYEEISAASQNADLIRYGCGNALRKGLKLHAWKIELINPEDNTTLRFCAKPPDGMQKLMEWCNMALPASFV